MAETETYWRTYWESRNKERDADLAAARQEIADLRRQLALSTELNDAYREREPQVEAMRTALTRAKDLLADMHSHNDVAARPEDCMACLAFEEIAALEGGAQEDALLEEVYEASPGADGVWVESVIKEKEKGDA